MPRFKVTVTETVYYEEVEVDAENEEEAKNKVINGEMPEVLNMDYSYEVEPV